MAKYILAVDQSTSATKAILFDSSAKVISRSTVAHKQYYPKPGWVEHNPEEIYEKTLLAIQNVLTQSGIKQSEIEALAITNQRETAVVWDKNTGKPVYNAIVWQCQRGADICNNLKNNGYERLIQSKTGLIIDPYFSASGVQWILDNVTGARKLAENNNLLFGTTDSWLIWKLTKGKVHATDYSNACRTMLFNIHDLCWDADIAKLLRIPLSVFPQVRFADADYGYTEENSVFTRKIKITGVMGDSHAALFGQHCFTPGLGKATYGTGSSVMMNIGNKPLESPGGLVTSVGYGVQNEISYVFEGNIHSTGATINWLVDDLKLIQNANESEELALSVPDNGEVYFVPAFVGLGAPYWDNDARAMVCGISRGTQKAHLVRAALEAIAYQVKDLTDLMSSKSGIGLKELRVDGGPTRNNFLMQFQADMLDAAINRSEIEEASALGVALAAGLATGIWKNFDELRQLRTKNDIISPEMTKSKRENLYGNWKKAVAKVLLNNK